MDMTENFSNRSDLVAVCTATVPGQKFGCYDPLRRKSLQWIRNTRWKRGSSRNLFAVMEIGAVTVVHLPSWFSRRQMNWECQVGSVRSRRVFRKNHGSFANLFGVVYLTTYDKLTSPDEVDRTVGLVITAGSDIEEELSRFKPKSNRKRFTPIPTKRNTNSRDQLIEKQRLFNLLHIVTDKYWFLPFSWRPLRFWITAFETVFAAFAKKIALIEL
ncbi:hypothetical protein BD560DRAFT_440881 [Blakeslea trispora]|nr:hypothetical protein BD560DRAFT_440881 [Blakeslea trispora]